MEIGVLSSVKRRSFCAWIKLWYCFFSKGKEIHLSIKLQGHKWEGAILTNSLNIVFTLTFGHYVFSGSSDIMVRSQVFHASDINLTITYVICKWFLSY